MTSKSEHPSVFTPPVKNDCGPFSRLDLFDSMEKILWFWPDLFIHSAESDPVLLEGLTLVRTVRLAGSQEALAVIRTTPALGVLMARKLLGVETTESLAEDAFAEFVNMFCGYLLGKIRQEGQTSFRHFLPLQLPREKWPQEPPAADLVVGMQGHLLEMRLWIISQAPGAEKVQP